MTLIFFDSKSKFSIVMLHSPMHIPSTGILTFTGDLTGSATGRDIFTVVGGWKKIHLRSVSLFLAFYGFCFASFVSSVLPVLTNIPIQQEGRRRTVPVDFIRTII